MAARRAQAVIDGSGKRRCAQCGDYIDPKDWCSDCQGKIIPCGATPPYGPHGSLTRAASAAYCDDACRNKASNDLQRIRRDQD
jgi:hypothetical protein